MEHNMTLKTYMAIMAERDAVIRERNLALDERRRAFAERDMATLQRDMAISERNVAIEERDKTLATLHFRESSMKENMSSPDSPGNNGTVRGGAKHLYHHHDHQQMSSIHQFTETTVYDQRQAKEIKGTSTKKKSRSPRKGKRQFEHDLNGNGEEDLYGHFLMLKGGLELNQVNFDESTMPVAVCSCIGVPQPCYKWGNGGWQSTCCTTAVSMYPLPLLSNKRHARVGGRKMSGGVFDKLLTRLVSEGYDTSTPLDLKDHWAKHGSNRYSTLK